MNERGLRFTCEGESLVGVLSLPLQAPPTVGVVVPVGGPQYRVGSHRQFVLLARRLAREGYAVLRFDSRGMGDSTGDFPGFDSLEADVEAAARTLLAEVPSLRRTVIWGLCDAASAALMAADRVPALAGLVLLNPWVRHADTLAKTEIKHYYTSRLLDLRFWRKLLSGQVAVIDAAREFTSKLWRIVRPGARRAVPEPADFRERMVRGAVGFEGSQLYVLSGRDHVAAEFGEFCTTQTRMQSLWSEPRVRRVDLPEADHTFSSRQLRQAVEDVTVEWLARLHRKTP